MVRLRTVDPFAERPFTGSPAAVRVLDEAPSDDWMAALARETSLPDTGGSRLPPAGMPATLHL